MNGNNTPDSPFAAPGQNTIPQNRPVTMTPSSISQNNQSLSMYYSKDKLQLPAGFYRPSNTFLVASSNFTDEMDKLVLPPEHEKQFTEWIDKGFLPVTKDQMRCGGCWAFAVCETISARLAIATNGKWNAPYGLSEQYLISCGDQLGVLQSQGCQGGIPQYAIDALSNGGIPEDIEDQNSAVKYSYYQTNLDENSSCSLGPGEGGTCNCEIVKSKISGPKYSTIGEAHTYTSHGPNNEIVGVDLWPNIPPETIKNNVERMKKAIYYEGPFTVGIQVTDAFYNFRPTNDNYFRNPPTSRSEGGHAVAILGWKTMPDGTPVWICKNSWGENWGYDFPNGPVWVNPKTGVSEQKYKGGFWNHVMGENDSFIESNAVGAHPNLKDPDISKYLPNNGELIPKEWFKTMTLRDIYLHHGVPNVKPNETKKKAQKDFEVNGFNVKIKKVGSAANFQAGIETIEFSDISNFFHNPLSKYLIVGDKQTFDKMMKFLPAPNTKISGDDMVDIIDDIQDHITDYVIIGIKGSMGVFFWVTGSVEEMDPFSISNFVGRTTDPGVISRILFAQTQSAKPTDNVYFVSKKSVEQFSLSKIFQYF